MTELRRLVGSVLVTGFAGENAPDWLVRRVDEGLGGVCLFGQNVVDAAQVRALTDRLHAAREDVLVLSDEEGGDVTRLEVRTGSSWPGHAALGRLDDTATTHAVAAAMGRQVRASGVDVALAPVVDVNSDPDNPVIGVRSFGADPDLVSRHGAAFVAGLQSAGVAACAKHFPGHGATRTDSHVELPSVRDDTATLLARDIAPFAAVAPEVRCVMTAHVVFPAFDDAPATMSRRLLALLREDLGFRGVIISDALDMHAVARGIGRSTGAVRALASGVDLLCIGNPCFPEEYDAEAALDEMTDAICRAVEDETLPVQRLQDAAGRVAGLTSWVREQAGAHAPHDDGDSGGDDQAWGADVARKVVQHRGDVRVTGAPLVVHVEGPRNLAAGPRASQLVAALALRAPATEVFDAASADDVSGITARGQGRPVVVIVGQRRSASARETLAALLTARPDAVVVYTGLPSRDDAGSRVVHTFGTGRASAGVVADLVLGECPG